MTERCITTGRIDPDAVSPTDLGAAARMPGALAYRIDDTANPNTVYAVAVPVAFRVGITTGGDAQWLEDVPAGAVLDTVSDHLTRTREER